MKIFGVGVALCLVTFCSVAGMLNIGGNLNVQVESMVDKRFDRIYRQQYDFSCGSATLASLLSFHYNDTVTELAVFKDMFDKGNKNKIRQQGFSMLDMKHFLSRRGYQSNGFKITLEQLARSQRPGITIINNNGYMRFVVVKAQRRNEVLVGDPAVGLKIIPKEEFEAMWEGRIFFMIQDRVEIAGYHYSFDKQYQSPAQANLGLPVDIQRLDVLSVIPTGNWDF